MTHQAAVRSARSPRRWATDPLAPVLLFAVGGLLAAAYGNTLTWALVGGLAGYTLSGSV